FYPLRQRHGLGVAERRIGLGVSVLITADLGVVVALGESGQDRVLDRCAQLQPRFASRTVEVGLERGAIQIELVREAFHQRADRRLLSPPRFLFFRLGSSLPAGAREALARTFLLN